MTVDICVWLWHFGVIIMQNSLSSILIKKKNILNCKVFHSRKVLNYLLPANFFDVFFIHSLFLLALLPVIFLLSCSTHQMVALLFFPLLNIRYFLISCCFFHFGKKKKEFSSHFAFAFVTRTHECWIVCSLCNWITGKRKRPGNTAHCLKIHEHTFTFIFH